jgi:hypothetical protein
LLIISSTETQYVSNVSIFLLVVATASRTTELGAREAVETAGEIFASNLLTPCPPRA